MQRLAAADWPPLVALQAPRGFGKTSAATWLLHQDTNLRHDRVWVNVPSGRVTSAQFWETVHRRLRHSGLTFEDWPTLQRSLANMNRRLVIAVDGLDNCDEQVDDEIAEVVRECDRVHVIGCARRARPLLEHAVLLDGVVVQRDDFSLDPVRARSLAALLGVELSEAAAADLHARVGPWPALFKLAATGAIVDRDSVVLDQSTVDRFVRRWLAQLPAEVRTGIGVLAVPCEMTVELAHELLGAQGLQELTTLLAEDGFLNYPDRWGFVLPSAVREAVTAALAQDEPDVYRRVSTRAAHWFESHSAPLKAMAHAINAADRPLVRRLLDDYWSLLLASEPGLARTALGMLEPESVNADARLLVARDYVLNLFIEDRADTAFHVGALAPGAMGRSRVAQRLSVRELLTLRSRGVADGGHAMLESIDLGELIAVSGWSSDVVEAVPAVLLEWALDLMLRAPGPTAIYGFVSAVGWASELGQQQVRADAAAGAALCHALVGHSLWAQQWLDADAGRGSSDADAEPSDLGRFMATLAGAVIARDRLQSPLAVDLQVPERVADLQVVRLWLQVSEMLASGRAREAVRLLDPYELGEAATGRPGLVDVMLVNAHVEAWVAAGQLEQARQFLLSIDPDVSRHPVAWALVDVQSGEFQRVVAATDHPNGLLPRQRIDLALLHAKAALQLHRRVEALDYFQHAVGMALRTGVRRPFTLISEDARHQLAEGDVQAQQLLNQAPIHALFATPNHGTGLSARELQVLQVVATGASFTSVARRLYVSPNTVKSQMRLIYRKLAVGGRDEAVQRARELGLLPREPSVDFITV